MCVHGHVEMWCWLRPCTRQRGVATRDAEQPSSQGGRPVRPGQQFSVRSFVLQPPVLFCPLHAAAATTTAGASWWAGSPANPHAAPRPAPAIQPLLPHALPTCAPPASSAVHCAAAWAPPVHRLPAASSAAAPGGRGIMHDHPSCGHPSRGSGSCWWWVGAVFGGARRLWWNVCVGV